MAKSLLEQYLEEVDCGRKILEIPGISFATYNIHPNEELFIDDVYIVPNARGTGLLEAMYNMLEREAKINKCKIISHKISHGNKNKETVIKKVNSLGFKFFREDEHELSFIKEI